jgi:hypothetical protein
LLLKCLELLLQCEGIDRHTSSSGTKSSSGLLLLLDEHGYGLLSLVRRGLWGG